MRKRILGLGLIVTMLVTSLVGCGSDEEKDPLLSESKETLVASIHDKDDQIAILNTKVSDLETLLKGVTGEDVPPTAISTIGDGTGRLSFNSYKNTITFPELLMYPNSISTPAENKIYIVDEVGFTPSSNWVLKMDGTTVELEHSNGITGTIKVVAYDDMYDPEILKVRIQEWVDTLPPDELMQYTKIFVADNFSGYDVLSSSSMIDAENAVLRIGMTAFGKKAISYAFVYRGEADSVKDEAVKSLISSIEMNGSKLTME